MASYKKTKRKLFGLISLGLLGFFTILTAFGDEGLLKLRKFYLLRNKIHAENQELFKTNQRLNQEINLLKEPLYTERLIREKLGYVKPKELVLILDTPAPSEHANPQHN